MPPQLALAICCIFVLWLFMRARKTCPMTSKSLWVPLLWVMLIGSRAISLWFSAGTKVVSPEDYLDGSPPDRQTFLALIVAGLLVLLMRRVKWGRLFASNRWVFLFFVYCAVSTIWSDYTFVSLKRWIKDAGNIVMIFIILTEAAPVQAFRAVFVRYAYAAIPFSALLILFFPDIGTYSHASWDFSQGGLVYETLYCGIAVEKNALGCSVFISGLFLIWDFIEPPAAGYKNTTRADFLSRAILMFMVIWLIVSAKSVTALVCLLLGTGIFLSLRLPSVRRQVRHLGMYSLAAAVLVIVIYASPAILKATVATFGRDLTFTGRTDIWTDALNVPINPAIGTGYQSFWLGNWVKPLWEKYSFHPNQAHNGYLEIYLNGGLIGFSLLLALIISTGGKLKRALLNGNREGTLYFALFITILFYNWTEAMFYGINLIWFILLTAALSTSRPSLESSGNLRKAYS